MTDTPPPAAALAAKCKAWQDVPGELSPTPWKAIVHPKYGDPYFLGVDVNGHRLDTMDCKPAKARANLERATEAVNVLPLAARALEVLVEAMVRIRDAKGDDGPNASGIAFNALRRAAAIVEEVSDEAK